MVQSSTQLILQQTPLALLMVGLGVLLTLFIGDAE
ncbi:hypothetical protein KCU_10773 [Pasteurella multocida subsp. multocida str. P52VAC]|nr:hypothetical protein KCU_10773 [Pasteurella multocida subsp. multocida str. P52VAC]